MSWASAGSQVHVSYIQAINGNAQTAAVLPASWAGLAADANVKVALFNNTTAPDNTVSRATAAYNTGQWVTANEQISSTQWPAGGIALASKTLNIATNVFTFNAASTSGTGNVTLANVFGCLVHDGTVGAGTGGTADMGICYNYFGGSQAVTAGTFTIVWNASGIFTVTCT